MPLIRGRDKKGIYYRWGKQKKYYYNPKNRRASAIAKSKALIQGYAIKAQQNGGKLAKADLEKLHKITFKLMPLKDELNGEGKFDLFPPGMRGGRKLTPFERDYLEKHMPNMGPVFRFDLDGDFEERTGNFLTNIPGDIARGLADAKREYNKDTLGVNKYIEKIPVAGQLINKWSGSGETKGEGILSDATSAIGSAVGNFIAPTPAVSAIAGWLAPASMSRKMRAFMQGYGGYTVTGVEAWRTPVFSVFNSFFKMFNRLRSMVGLKNEFTVDRLYHLYLIIRANKDGDNKVWRMERNQVMQVSDAQPIDYTEDIPKYRQGMKAELKEQKVVSQMMEAFVAEATKRNPTMGPWRYAALPYNGVPANNCQWFCVDFLRGNGISTPQLEHFILQFVDEIAPGPIKRIMQLVTDVGGVASQAIGGEKEKDELSESWSSRQEELESFLA